MRFGSSAVFQTVRYMVSESTVSDGTFAHTTVFQMVFGYGIPTLRKANGTVYGILFLRGRQMARYMVTFFSW